MKSSFLAVVVLAALSAPAVAQQPAIQFQSVPGDCPGGVCARVSSTVSQVRTAVAAGLPPVVAPVVRSAPVAAQSEHRLFNGHGWYPGKAVRHVVTTTRHILGR